MATKIIKHIDDSVWNVFAGRCKTKRVRMGVELSEILRRELGGKNNVA